MRKKLREIMDKEEGFTLVELLAVIVILGIIVAIAVPSIGSIISSSQGKADDAEVELIKDAGRLYFTTDEDGVKLEGNLRVVTVETLVKKGYLELRDSGKDGTVKVVDGEYTFIEGVTVTEETTI